MMPLSLSISPRAMSAFSPDTESSLQGRMCDASCTVQYNTVSLCGMKLLEKEMDGLTLANVMNSW